VPRVKARLSGLRSKPKWTARTRIWAPSPLLGRWIPAPPRASARAPPTVPVRARSPAEPRDTDHGKAGLQNHGRRERGALAQHSRQQSFASGEMIQSGRGALDSRACSEW
jgi:hypothetical protein